MYQYRETFYVIKLDHWIFTYRMLGNIFQLFSFPTKNVRCLWKWRREKPHIHTNNAFTDTTAMQEKLGGCLLFLLFPE